MDPRLLLVPKQRQVMTGALLQALDVLQMSALELSQHILEEVERNPLLELQGPPCIPLIRTEHEPAAEVTLDEHLRAQIREAFATPEEVQQAEELLERLDDKGFVEGMVPEGCERVLAVLQTFDPRGIFARNLQECLLLQLEEGESTHLLVRDYFDDLLKKRFAKIEKLFSPATIQKLAHLHFRPAAAFQKTIAPTIYPDLALLHVEGKWRLAFPERALPQFAWVHYDLEPSEQALVKGWISSAKWLEQCVSRRREILKQIGKFLTQRQALYLLNQGPLFPCTLREAAAECQMHESTLSRAVCHKYVETPRGILPLRSFFTTSPIPVAKDLLLQLIEQEEHPLSDAELASQLAQKGVKLARRTIAKYRKELKIGSAHDRPYSSRQSRHERTIAKYRKELKIGSAHDRPYSSQKAAREPPRVSARDKEALSAEPKRSAPRRIVRQSQHERPDR